MIKDLKEALAENAKLHSEVSRINDAAPLDGSVERMSQHRVAMQCIRELKAENAMLLEKYRLLHDAYEHSLMREKKLQEDLETIECEDYARYTNPYENISDVVKKALK